MGAGIMEHLTLSNEHCWRGGGGGGVTTIASFYIIIPSSADFILQ